MTDCRTHEADSPYHRTLPIGARLSAEALVKDELSSFEAVTLKPLEPMLVPEEPRAAVGDPQNCAHCRPSEHTIWSDDLWHVNAGFMPMSIPYIGGPAPNSHCTLDTAPGDVLASLGSVLQRLNVAVMSIPGVARTHFAGRGPMLAFWDDVLPEMPADLQEEHLRIVAESLAAGGGTAFPNR